MSTVASDVISGFGQRSGRSGPAFAILYRPTAAGADGIDVVTGTAATVDRIGDLALPQSIASPSDPRHDVLALIPYRQIHERGFACVDDGTPLVAITIEQQYRFTVDDVTAALPDTPIRITGEHFDTDDDEYADIVGRVLADEIGTGAGANFVIRRSFVADITDYSPRTALAMFRRLLAREVGAYWTFVVHTGDRTLIGATPEQHVGLSAGRVTMNPISGTYRYPEGGPTLPGVLDFLADRKEIDELFMVVDEELKMMGRVCTTGGRVAGPFLKEMARLAHTEYMIEGESTLDVRDILRETMFAPTVTGSPLENACRVITRYEPDGRGYYSGAIALIGRDTVGRQTMDSAIMIRTADIDRTGRMVVGVGATLVRHSDPWSEVAETKAKAAGLLAVERTSTVDEQGYESVGRHPAVRRALAERNEQLADYWFEGVESIPRTADISVLVIDAEDTFTSMLAHQLRSLGCRVSITGWNICQLSDLTDSELVVLGPGPGDPQDGNDPKIRAMRRIARHLLYGGVPFLAVCLGHQVLSRTLGFPLVRRESPNQGVQREIDLFGRTERVGFYNTFAAWADRDAVECVGVGTVGVCRDRWTNEVHALRGPNFRSFQFHPESVLTAHGVSVLGEQVAALLGGAEEALAG